MALHRAYLRMAGSQITAPVQIVFIHFIVKEINSLKGFPRPKHSPLGPWGSRQQATWLVSLPSWGEGTGGEEGSQQKGLGRPAPAHWAQPGGSRGTRPRGLRPLHLAAHLAGAGAGRMLTRPCGSSGGT